MAVVIALGIAVVVVAFVAAPFFLLGGQSNPGRGEEQVPVALQELLAEKETIYAAIQELDFDRVSGKLSDEDHRLLRRRHEAQAAAVLQQIDELQARLAAAAGSGKPRREARQG